MATAVSPGSGSREGDLTEEGFEVLRAAVNLARNEQVRTVASLRKRLGELFPQTDRAVIQKALTMWADREVAKA